MEITPKTLAEAPPPPPPPATQTLENPIGSAEPSCDSRESRVSPSGSDLLPDEPVTNAWDDEGSHMPDAALGTPAVPDATMEVQVALPESGEGFPPDGSCLKAGDEMWLPVTMAAGRGEGIDGADALFMETEECCRGDPVLINADVEMLATDIAAVMVETSESPEAILVIPSQLTLTEPIAEKDLGMMEFVDEEMKAKQSPYVNRKSSGLEKCDSEAKTELIQGENNKPSDADAPFMETEEYSGGDPVLINTYVEMPATDIAVVMVENSENPEAILENPSQSTLIEPIAAKDLGMMELVYEEMKAKQSPYVNRKSSGLDECDAEAKTELIQGENSKPSDLEESSGKSKGAPKKLDKVSSSLQCNNIDVAVVLSEFLLTAINPLHLKWHRSAKIVRGFFSEYRSLVYSDAEFQAYLHASCLFDVDGQLATNAMSDDSKEAKSVRKRNKRKSRVNDETLLELGHDTAISSGKGKGSKRRMMMNGKSPMVSDGSESKSQNKMKGSMHGAADGEKSKNVAIGGTPMELNWELTDCSKVLNLGQKRKKNNGEGKGGPQAGSCQKTANASGEGKGSYQKKRNIEKALSGSPAALFLTFTPGTTLPSRDELISTFGTYGDLMEPKAEFLQDSNSARILFLRSSDAEKAFNSPDRRTSFRSQLSSCRLRYLPEVKSPLPYVKRTLTMMISRLTRSSLGKNAGSASWSKMEGMEDLVASIKGLLDRVDKITEPPVAPLP